MLRSLLKLSTAMTTASLLTMSLPPSRLFHSEITNESHAQAMLVLEQCSLSYSSESQDTVTQNCKGMALLAMSSLLSRRGNYDDAMGKLELVNLIVAAMEALAGLNLDLGRDDTSLVLPNKCLEILESEEFKSSGVDFDATNACGKAVKGLAELIIVFFLVVHFNVVALFLGYTLNAHYLFATESYFQGIVALSYGEFLHAIQNFQSAKDLYQKATSTFVTEGSTSLEGLHKALHLVREKGESSISIEDFLSLSTKSLLANTRGRDIHKRHKENAIAEEYVDESRPSEAFRKKFQT
ncbi:hypothetical protein K2173_004610 [Erythroxylum novogranatense]|uniref:Uncharacterized protein n=1 Tax=Erythroxylum novogranatense TaxID=1862640 RepID=A0AAV8T4V2_9ROSI|nr:hypothetical protein K2173_004610 [Erythroxylum novogranatense]